jgi:hypothetical protein
VGSVAQVKRQFSAAMGCTARLSSHFRAGAETRLAACGRAQLALDEGLHQQGEEVVGYLPHDEPNGSRG